MLIARAAGHVSWWVFVVARLISELGLTTGGGLPRRYADYGADSAFGTGPGQAGRLPPGLTDPFQYADVIAVVTVTALAVTLIAALVQAVLGRRWLLGVGTVLAPVVGAAIILTALYERAGYLGGGQLNLPSPVVLVLVLFGVAIREVWSRVILPRGVQKP